jgi:hypothetical protein
MSLPLSARLKGRLNLHNRSKRAILGAIAQERYSQPCCNRLSPAAAPAKYVSPRLFSSLSKDAATQPAEYDPKKRWMVIPPANLVHLSIGSVYAYSMWTPGLTHVLGVVSSAAADWTHSDVVPVLSAAAITLGVTTATLGSWVEKVGPRTSGFVGSILWGSGLMVTGVGVHLHSLPLVYAGYGLIGGVG